ncbi:protein unc-93 homolog A isoform X3 [Pteropus medius]|uniref:protein unc-93 homolog A isoform X3 n=1 Tax=Pteropus vampyrus TaxID=132908 RepID=UPI00196A9E78|nr:protein unc-93 homolog A isoform X3 [Pteropus giganteus]
MERTLRNVLVVSLGFLLLFTAYGGLQSLQSSLYSEEGLGVTVLSTLYGAVLLSSMLLPPLLIRTLGCKWTIVASMSCYVAFSLGNFYASWYTLIPTSILLGLGAAPLWSAQGTYLTLMGNVQAEEAGRVARDVVNRAHPRAAAPVLWGQGLPDGQGAHQQHPACPPEADLHPAGHLHRKRCPGGSAGSAVSRTRKRRSAEKRSREPISIFSVHFTVDLQAVWRQTSAFPHSAADVQWIRTGFPGGRLHQVLRHLRSGHPVCGLRHDLLLGHQRTVLRAVRQAVPAHGPGGTLHARRGHPPVLHRRPPAVEAEPRPAGRLLRVCRSLGRGRRRLADTEQRSRPGREWLRLPAGRTVATRRSDRGRRATGAHCGPCRPE